ncbi:MAG: acetylglutamate kinase [Bacteroidota bacterium]
MALGSRRRQLDDMSALATSPMPTAQPLSVVKLGGATLTDPADLAAVWASVRALHEAGTDTIIVHGGGAQSTALARQLGHEPEIVAGRRVTSDLDLDVALYVLRGALNARLVASGLAAGVRAAGISGADGGCVQVERRPPRQLEGRTVDFGHVGDVVGTDATLPRALLDAGFVPVIATVCSDAAGALYNVNADTVAAALAVALGATRLDLVTGAGGVRRNAEDPASRIRQLDADAIEAGVRDGWITDGMRPKLTVALDALAKGVASVRIVAPDALAEDDAGTLITAAP